MRGAWLPLLLVFASLVVPRDAARACAIIDPARTKVAGEEVLIVWDRATQTEHFVRHLSFGDASSDFGFLVPTPTRPTLGEVPDAVFRKLFDLYRRPLPHYHSSGRHTHGAAASAVEVVEERRVAGLDATVLAATDATALAHWLGAHHYTESPAITRYLARYVAEAYYVTAFRYAHGGASGTTFGTQAVELGFATPRPYFPYAEPDDAPQVPGRVFRISVVGDERVAGEVGGRPWSGPTVFADRPDALATALDGAVPASAIPAHAWLTTFQEDASVRGADDLFFVRAHAQSPVRGTVDHPVGEVTPPADARDPIF